MKSWWFAAASVVVAGLIIALVVQLRQHPAWASPAETGAATAAAMFTALAAFASYRSAQSSAQAASEARAALALHHRPYFGFDLKQSEDGVLRLNTRLGEGGKDLVASWKDKEAKTHSWSLPDSGGLLVLATVRVVEYADVQEGRMYTSIDAQHVEFQFRDQATNSLWKVALPRHSDGSHLAVEETLPKLVP